MDWVNNHEASGSLQISTDVIAKIARLAALEIDGVAEISTGNSAAGSFLGKIAPPRPILVQLNEGVADIEISLMVKYGTKIPEISEKIQENVKNSVQNMTSITVNSVDLVVTGIAEEAEEQA